jgi:hypothetical protein
MFPFGFIFGMNYVGTFALTIVDLNPDFSDCREVKVKCYTFSNPTRGALFEDFNVDVAWDLQTGDFYVGSAVLV